MFSSKCESVPKWAVFALAVFLLTACATASLAALPGAPTIGGATPGNGQASINFTPPGFTGYSTLTGFTVTSSPGSFTARGLASPITVQGLANGTGYTFSVAAATSSGVGPSSAVSNQVTPTSSGPLISHLLSSDPGALQVMSGTPYNMDDPGWIVNGLQNRNVFAYKIFAGLFMLGYQTDQMATGGDQTNTLKVFQGINGLPVTNILSAACLNALDLQLAARELLLTTLAGGLTPALYSHLEPLNANDVSNDTVAALYSSPMSALPLSLQMDPTEQVRCVAGQCVGAILDSGGVKAAPFPTDLSSDYFFVPAYFDPRVSNSRLPGAAVAVDTLLHEYAHYLDGYLNGWVRSNPTIGWMYSAAYHLGVVDNAGFYSIGYDLAHPVAGPCYPKKSNNPQDWLSYYPFSNSLTCPAGYYVLWEDWAESFSMYITAGRDFRAAALKSSMVAARYAWLKTNVFSGVEYDTDLPQGSNSGCNDVPGYASRQPGYVHCNTGYVWDFTLPHALVNGSCGSAAGVASFAAPAANLCAGGAPSAVDRTTTWNWSCRGLNGGSDAASCSAGVLAGTPPGAPTIGVVEYGRGGATVFFTPPASDGGSPVTVYTVTSSPGKVTGTGSSSPITVTGLTNGTSYSFTVTASNVYGASAPSAASAYATARPYMPSSGTVNNLVVFVRFSDQAEFSKPFSSYAGLFNTGATSLKNFYLESSYNTLTVNSTFYPAPDADAVVSYLDSHPTGYYQPYNASSNPIGYQGLFTSREAELVTNALSAISSQVPDGLNLDGDNDGYIDHITFEVASTSAVPLPTIFNSRAASDTTGTINFKGKQVGSYTFVSAAQDFTGQYPGSTEIHEMGHSLGYPDLRGGGSHYPVSDYDVMSLAVPTHSGAYEKYRFTGWIPNIPEITTTGTFSLNDITQATNNSYKMRLPNNEFLILEYRKQAGPFESNLHGSGLCITKVNESAGFWNNINGPPYFLYYFRPGASYGNDSPGKDFTCLSAETGRVQFNDRSNPACFLSDGGPCGISISDIGSAAGSSITFSVGDPNNVSVVHLIGGQIKNGGNAVPGQTVTLSGTTSATTVTDGAGKYFFVVNDGGDYTVSVSATNLTFSPPSASFTHVTGDVTCDFAAAYKTYTISGKVSSAGVPLIADVHIVCSNGGSYSSPTQTDDLTGAYSFTVNSGGDCLVYSQKTDYFFAPNGTTFTNVTGNQVQDFAASTITLTGNVSQNGSPLSGVSVSCPGAITTSPLTTGANGNYSFTVSVGNGASYTVTPASASYGFAPASATFTGVEGTQTQNFLATALPVTKTALDSSANPALLAQSVTFTATVTGSSPSGTVTFRDGAITLCSAVSLSGGRALCTTGALSVGSHSITAAYSGNVGNAASASAALIQSVATVPGAPAGLVNTALGAPNTGQVTVSFSAPASDGGSAVTGYTVISNPAGPSDSNAGSTSLSHLITGLTPYAIYSFTVVAANNIGSGAPSQASNSVIPQGFPGAPTGATATPGNGQASVAFAAPVSGGSPGISGYTVSSNPPGGTDASAGQSSLTHAVTGLTNGVPYTFTVTATNSYGTGAASAPSTSVTPYTIPGAPIGASALVGNAQATVTFSAPASDGGSPIIGYTVFGTGGTDSNAGSSGLSHVVTGLTPGVTYSFSVRASNAAGWSNASASSNSVTPVGAPSTPGSPFPSRGGSANSVSVAFGLSSNDGGSPLTGYTVTASPGGLTGTGGGTPVIVSGLTGGSAYTFTVTAANTYAVSSASTVSSSIIAYGAPGSPGAVAAVPGNGTATVTFTAPVSTGGTAITGYTVTSFPAGGTDNNGGTPGTSHIVSGLANGTSYSFTVTASNGYYPSAASVPSNSVMPGIPGTPSFPFAPSIMSATSVNVSVNAPANNGSPITSYTATSSPDGVIMTAGTGNILMTGLTTCTSYTFTVFATNSVGSGAASAASTPVIPYSTSAPTAPTIGTATVGNGSATVGFTPPSGLCSLVPISYTVQAYSSGGTLQSGLVGTGSASPIIVNGLSNGSTYKFKVSVTNGTHTSAYSSSFSNSIVPVKNSQDITVTTPAPANTVYNSQFTVAATASSGLPVAYSSGSTGVCTVSGATFTMIAASGTCVVQYDQPGDGSYNAASRVIGNTGATKAGQSIGTIGFSPASLAVSGSTTASASGGASGVAVAFSSTTTGICNVSGTNGTTVTAVAAGICTIAANQAGNNNYTAAGQVTQDITVGVGSQTISFSPPAGASYGDAAITLSGLSTSSLPVGFTLVNGLGSLNGNLLTITGVGTITLKASQGGNGNYAAAPDVQKTIVVAPKPLIVTANNASRAYGDPNPANPGFTAPGLFGSDSISSVTYTFAATATATANVGSAHSVTPSAAVFGSGSTANYTISYSAGTLTIAGTASQTISFNPNASASYGDAAITLSGTSTSSLPVGFTLVNGPGTLNGNLLTITGVGTITLKASQGGNGNYAAAPDVQKTIVVAVKPLIVTANSASRAYGDPNPTNPGFTAPGLVGGDSIISVTYSYAGTATATANVGSAHSITPSAASFVSGTSDNYSIIYSDGTLTITPSLDTAGPILNLSALPDGAMTNNPTLNVSGTVSDTESGLKHLTINGIPVSVDSNNSFSFALTLQDGLNTIVTIASDYSNNLTTDSRAITLDTQIPTLTVTTPADNSLVKTESVVISGDVSETPSLVTITLNNGTSVNASLKGSTFSATVILTNGLNHLEIVATDLAHNVSATAKRTVTSDTTGPSLSITNPAQDITTGQAGLTVAGDVSDAITAVSVIITVDGSIYMPIIAKGSFSQAIIFDSQKTYAITVTATDAAGNQSTVTRNVIYLVKPQLKAGDCDGNGETSITEVQSAIDMFLGLKQVEGCVDLNNDNFVSISEVQKVNNAFLGL